MVLAPRRPHDCQALPHALGTGVHACSAEGVHHRSTIVGPSQSKLRNAGCIYRFSGALHRQTSVPVGETVDTTGAGDAFVAALLAALPAQPRDLDAPTLDYMTRRACRAGAITVTQRGAIPALPTTSLLDAV